MTEQIENVAIRAMANLMIKEIQTGPAADWLDLSDIFDILFEPKHLMVMQKIHRLGVATIIVGAMKTELFEMAFWILSEFEFIGGPYWIIQEEVLRHALLDKIRSCLKKEFPSKRKFSAASIKVIEKVLPTEETPEIKNRTLHQKIAELRVEFISLIERLKNSNNPQVLFYTFST
jgi:hypothetical protein